MISATHFPALYRGTRTKSDDSQSRAESDDSQFSVWDLGFGTLSDGSQFVSTAGGKGQEGAP